MCIYVYMCVCMYACMNECMYELSAFVMMLSRSFLPLGKLMCEVPCGVPCGIPCQVPCLKCACMYVEVSMYVCMDVVTIWWLVWC
jgi:hypothetical protein